MEKTYKQLTIPKLNWDKQTFTNTNATLIAQPLEPGFGITIGNALRRVLLSAIEGSSVTSFIIKGVNNEFSSIPGMVEDALQVALNIKEIVVKSSNGLPGKMVVKKNSSGPVTVNDIVPDQHLELINKDHVIGTVSVNGSCEIEFFVENGRGYQPAQWPHDKQYQEDGRMYIDALFCPITRVMVDVEKTRVGEAIDYDKLILKIDTNGAITPIDAVHYATSVLRTQLEHFLNASEIPFNQLGSAFELVNEKNQSSEEKTHHVISNLEMLPIDLILKPIEDLELTVRAHNCLKQAGIKRVIDLVNLTREGLLGIKNFGRKSLTEVEESVEGVGLHFGMNLKEEDLLKAIEQRDNSN
jgi:DNA-directed RNA polymerase subunit alpha